VGVNRAYSILHVKSIDEDKRIISGIATTPEPDRMGDVIEPLGVSFKNPLPLLLHHDTKQPVGFTTLKKPTKDGVEFTATLPTIADAGKLRDRVDEAWQSIKAGLISGVSIGFRSIEEAFNKDTGGFRFLKSEVVELSLVTIPANASASIHTIKSLDTADQAASGRHLPGVSGTSTVVRLQKAPAPMTITEQITQWSNTRAPKAARMSELMTKSAETGVTLDDAQSEEYDGLEREIESIDKHLVRLRTQEKAALTVATPITTTTHNAITASELRGGTGVHQVSVKANVPPGIPFARMCMALAAGGGDSYKTLQITKQWKDSTPEVEGMVEHMWRTKAAVAVGTTTDSTWAGPLVVTQPLNDFLDLLRPQTLLGRVPGLKHVPFNISIPTQTTGGTYGWVGQNKPKPVTKADYLAVTLAFNKVAGIIVLSEELVTLSTPSAEALVRDEMLKGMSTFLDQQFTDPAVAVSAGINPASITNGAATIASSGVTGAAAKTDLSSRVGVFVAANYNLGESVWLMNEANAFGIGLSVNGLGQPLFPGFTGLTGGMLMGIPVVVSNSVGARIILAHTPSILYADEGGIRIDVSREASVQMDSAPTDTVDATTVYLSLWQRNLIGLKAERIITWKVARSTAVTYITTAASYNGT
jgi:HK97 family phage major capsid protein/HK97 family phage prohead protease